MFSAPSGNGKTTLVHHLLQQIYPWVFLFLLHHAPQRRRGKRKDYYFLTEEELKENEEDAFVEHEEVYKGALYGTLQSELIAYGRKENMSF